MKNIAFGLIILFCSLSSNFLKACDGLSTTVTNEYIGNGQYLLTVEICEFVSNGSTLNGTLTASAQIFGIIIEVNGANVIGINTASVTGTSTGVTIFPTQTAGNTVEYGDWGNPAAPIFLAYGDPQECWTFEFIVDGPAASVNVFSSSFVGASQPGAGMTQHNGVWACSEPTAVPPPICSSDWSPPIFCVGETTPFDLNSTTTGNGVFSGTGVNSGTGIFNPTGLTGNISITFTVGDAGFNCSTVHDIIFTDLTPPNLTDQTICAGDAVNLDATVATTTNCDYTLVLDDNAGNGWQSSSWFFPDDAFVDIYINGVLWMAGAAVANCGNTTPCQNIISIPVNDGDIIQLDYDHGDNNGQNSIFLYDGNGNLINSISNPPNGYLGGGVTVACGPGVLSYSWSPTTGLSDPNSATPVATPASTTTYTVSISSPNIACVGQTSVTITVNPCSNTCSMTGITATAGACVPGNTHELTGTVSYQDPPATGFLIVSDCNGADDTLAPPFGTQFNFEFTAQADGSTCAITAYFTADPTCTISVNETYPPTCGCTINAGPDQAICIGASATLTGSGADTYSWDNGLGLGQVQNVTPLVTTTYILEGSTLAGCTGKDTVVVTVNPLPIVGAGLDKSVCEGTSVTLSGTGAATYVWDNGITNGTAFTAMLSQTYTVTGTDANGCVNTDEMLVNVTLWEDSTFIYNASTFCASGTDPVLNLTGTPGGAFTSSPAGLSLDGSTGAITLNTSANNTYSVTYTTPGVCPTAHTLQITVTNLAVADFTFGQYCLNGTDPNPTFINGGTGGTFSAAPVGLVINPVTGIVDLGASTPGNYTVTNDINIAGCTAVQATSPIEVFSLPTATISGGGTVCQGEPLPDIQFDLVGSGNWTVTYTVNGVNSLFTTGTNPYVLSGAGTGTYALVQVKDNNSGCTNTAIGNATVLVNPIPDFISPANLVRCHGNQIVIPGFSSSFNGTTFNWVNLGQDIGVGMSGSGNMGAFTGNNTSGSPQIAIIEVTPTLNGCLGAPGQFLITINPLPIIDVSVQIPPACLPTNVTVTNNGSPVINCLWSFGDGTISTTCGPQAHTYIASGCFDISLTVSDLVGCSSSQTYIDIVCLDPNPIANFIFDPSVTDVSYTDIQFTNLSENASSYAWTFGDNTQGSNLENPNHIYPDVPGEYIITLVAENDFGCVDTAYSKIIIRDILIYYVPNAFTPDNDAFNQTFKPVFTSGFDPFDYTLLIFDRWGELVFESHNSEVGWDGKFQGNYVPDGVYIWKIEFKETMTDKRHKAYGHVTILR